MYSSKLKKILLASLSAIAFTVSLLAGPGQVLVRVVEDASSATLEGATVSIPELNIKKGTDRSGRITLRDVPAGEYNLTVSYRGLPDETVAVTVESDGSVAVPVRMGGQPDDSVVVLDEVYVGNNSITSEDIAQQMRLNSLNISDVVAADTVGQLPDRSVADAVRRLPGISVERGSGQTQNEYVTIRGMYSDFNKVLVDGVAVTVSNFEGASRSVPLNVISSEVADTIEVTKAPTPDMDGDAIGGTINIRTRNAFDYGGRYASAEFTLGYTDLLNDFTGDVPVDNFYPSFDVSYSDFLNEDQTLGYSLSANYSNDVYANSEVSASYNDDPLDADYRLLNGFYFPELVRTQEILEDVERYGVTSSLEWRPDDSFSLAARYSFSRTDTVIDRHRTTYFNNGFFNNPTTNDGQNYTNYLYDGFVDKNVSHFEDQQDVHVLSVSLEKEYDAWVVNADLGYNFSSFEESPEDTFRATLTQFSQAFDFEYDATGDSYTPRVISPAGFDENDIASYDALLNADQIAADIDDSEFVFGADAERDLDIMDLPVKFKFGGKARIRTREFVDQSRTFGFADIFGDARIPGLVADYNVKSRVDGAYGETFYLDSDRTLDYINALEDEATIVADPDDPLFDASNSFEVDENIYATYAQGTVEMGKLKLLAGVRMEFTDVEFRGTDVDFNTNTLTQVTESNDYVDILPGIHARYDYSDKVIIRGSVNKTLARASYRQLNPTESRSPSGDPGIRDSVSRGNINLDPTESWNFDLGVDYYYSREGFLSVGAFAKIMENNIYTVTTNEFIPSAAATDRITETFNAEGAEVYGLEFLIDQKFGFITPHLSNFGASFNTTLTDSNVDTGLAGRDDLDLFGQVGTAINASIYYRSEKARARLSYNWTDDFLLVGGIDLDDANFDEYADAYGTLDFSCGYNILENVELFFEAKNLTNEANRGYYGNDTRLSYNSYSGSSYFMGVSWNL